MENPHYQRVHYCELILREFLGVVERGRTDIWRDIEVVLRYVLFAVVCHHHLTTTSSHIIPHHPMPSSHDRHPHFRHCGSLFLDRRTVLEVGRRLRSMEKGLLMAGRGVKFSRWVDVTSPDDAFV